MKNFMSITVATALSVAAVSAAGAAQGKWLLPLLIFQTGQANTHYGCDLTFANVGAVAVNVEGIRPECPLPVCPQPWEGLAISPGQMAAGFEANGNPGRFVTIDNASDLAASLRLYASRAEEAPQTVAVPVVPLTSFTTSPIHLVKVMPTDSRRGHLRVYAERTTLVRVRLIDWLGGVIEERTLELSIPVDAHDPAFGEIAPLPKATKPYRVEIATADETVPIWAFISQADNEDLRFTVIAP